jgi:hypothetical protein
LRDSNQSSRLVEFLGPGVNERMTIEVVDGSDQTESEFLPECDADVNEARSE